MGYLGIVPLEWAQGMSEGSCRNRQVHSNIPDLIPVDERPPSADKNSSGL